MSNETGTRRPRAENYVPADSIDAVPDAIAAAVTVAGNPAAATTTATAMDPTPPLASRRSLYGEPTSPLRGGGRGYGICT